MKNIDIINKVLVPLAAMAEIRPQATFKLTKAAQDFGGGWMRPEKCGIWCDCNKPFDKIRAAKRRKREIAKASRRRNRK